MTRKDLPAARIRIGLGAGQSVGVYGHTELGLPTVELAGDLDGLKYMKPETAEHLAEALKLAAGLARGEAVPTALDCFLNERKKTPPRS